MEEVTGYFPSGMLVRYHLLLDFRHYEKKLLHYSTSLSVAYDHFVEMWVL